MKTNEYLAEGGQLKFVKSLFKESLEASNVSLFTVLVGKATEAERIKRFLSRRA
jgi:hypothetical protein